MKGPIFVPDSGIITKKARSSIIESRERAIISARATLDKKAKETAVLELKDLTFIAEYFVICSGESTTQVRAIADYVENVMRSRGIRPLRVEGISFCRWVLMDYGDIIVHIFDDETRAYYELEKFWLDAPRISYEEKGGSEAEAKATSHADDKTEDFLGRKDERTVSH
ncbi:MAG: ribosome silencing factor [Nitrospirales bacterium]|nr:ribosome silencing factor [Nitrospirales bacterium]